MRVDSFTFGKIVINGETYTSDVIIYPDKVDAAWWRAEGHRLQLSDLTTALQAKPDVLVIGTGYAGVMHVSKEIIERIEMLRIEVKVEKTSKAIEMFNALQGTRTVIAALHITC